MRNFMSIFIRVFFRFLMIFSFRQGEASKNVSLFFGIRSFGVFLTAYTGGLLLEYLHKKTSKLFLSFLFLFFIDLTFSLPKSSQSPLFSRVYQRAEPFACKKLNRIKDLRKRSPLKKTSDYSRKTQGKIPQKTSQLKKPRISQKSGFL